MVVISAKWATDKGDSTNGGQSFDVSPDNATLYQATNVENFSNIKKINNISYNLNDVRVGTLRYINETDSSVDFQNIRGDQTGDYTILVRYSNGVTSDASHTVNGTKIGSVNYPATVNWDRFFVE